MKRWYTSDTHFFHENIIKLCHRPFENVHSMNGCIRRNWNEIVDPDDEVYHLGDVYLNRIKGGNASADNVNSFLGSLNGHKYVVLGNHDDPNDYILKSHFTILPPNYEVKYEDKRIVLSHYPMRAWNGSFGGSLHFFGHTHGLLENTQQSMDVGVDCWNFAPILSSVSSMGMTNGKPIEEDKYRDAVIKPR